MLRHLITFIAEIFIDYKFLMMDIENTLLDSHY